jgi:hypothetical protein
LAGGHDEEPPGIESARQAAREAQDRLTTARAARTAIDDRAREAAQSLESTKGYAVRQARAVAWEELLPTTTAMIAEVQKAQQVVVQLMAPLLVLNRLTPYPFPKDDACAVALERQCDEFYGSGATWACCEPNPPHAPTPWADLVEALVADPNLKLPKS